MLGKRGAQPTRATLYAAVQARIIQAMKRHLRTCGLGTLMRLRPTWVVAAGALAIHFSTAPAWAQRPGHVVEEEGGLLQWGIAVGLAIVICVSAFLNPKRSHRS
ncbi:unnamed protein product [marine sediment metagenome]|uniref:Uncharacterized protein n=1 Tax=marine sediment metagenome TaxID=412755 RepID=X0YS31_9ZZZZ